jgi:hypothetical protein
VTTRTRRRAFRFRSNSDRHPTPHAGRDPSATCRTESTDPADHRSSCGNLISRGSQLHRECLEQPSLARRLQPPVRSWSSSLFRFIWSAAHADSSRGRKRLAAVRLFRGPVRNLQRPDRANH